jgi:hypothetical protein
MRRFTSQLAAVAASLVFAGPAGADIIFETGNNPQPDEENILFNGAGSVSGPATTVVGVTNTSGLPIFFTGLENLVTPSTGQARIEAEDGAFTDLTLGVQDGAFLDFILNPDIGGQGGSVTGTIHVTVNEVGGGTAETDFDVSSAGNNFLTIFATNGQSIQSINISSTAPIEFVDLAQPRISGAVSCPPGSTDPTCIGLLIPEPNILALFGIAVAGLGGIGVLRRRKV